MDVYEIVTNRILEDLKKGTIPWKKPWLGGSGAVSHVNGKSYSLLNQFLLGCSGEWLTYQQAVKEGGRVKKGEKGSIVVFWKFIEKKLDELDDDGEQRVQRIPFLKYITVFEVGQCEGIDYKYIKVRDSVDAPVADEHAEEIFTNYTEKEGIAVNKEGVRAFYRPSTDSITVPPIELFSDVAEYYSTLFHEAVHSTGSLKRLAREGVTTSHFFGDETYSKEELIAEIGASMLTNIVGLNTESSDKNNVAYIQSWMKELEKDKRLIVSASSKAEKAVKLILGELKITHDMVEEGAM